MVCKTKIYIFRINCPDMISMEYFLRETHRNFNGRAYVENAMTVVRRKETSVIAYFFLGCLTC